MEERIPGRVQVFDIVYLFIFSVLVFLLLTISPGKSEGNKKSMQKEEAS
jgi:hypothetical protein